MTIIVNYGVWCAHVHHKANTISHLAHHKSLETSHHHHHGFTPAPHIVKPHKDNCLHDAECVLPVQCPAHVQEQGALKCTTLSGRSGLCCSTGQNHTGI